MNWYTDGVLSLIFDPCGASNVGTVQRAERN
jgi:hypothetical protein